MKGLGLLQGFLGFYRDTLRVPWLRLTNKGSSKGSIRAALRDFYLEDQGT